MQLHFFNDDAVHAKGDICDDNREILADVDAKVLEAGASTAVAGMGHREPVLLALLLAGEVGQLVEQVVRGGVPLLGPPH